MGWIAALLLPLDVGRAAARAGRIALFLAAVAAVLFPASRAAGTEVLGDRIVSAGALALCGIALVAAGSRWPVAIGAACVPAVAAIVTGGAWMLVVSALACAYVAAAIVPRTAPPIEPDLHPRPDAARETVESVATALVLALVVREFGFEAFKIPTGSMEPTILGDGGWRSERRRGDRLLAFKASFRDPERWEITVFRWPLFRPTHYIKRCIGLPGERLVIAGGDVYADGVLQSKPDAVQESMWQRVFPSDREGVTADFVREFRDAGPGWTPETSHVRADTAAFGASQMSSIVVAHDFEADFRFSFDVDVEEWKDDGVLELVSSTKDGDVVLRIGRSGATVTAPRCAEPVALAAGAGVSGERLGRSFRIGLGVADRVVRVLADGRVVARVAYPDEERTERMTGTARIGAAGIRAVLSRFEGSNDAQYRGYHDLQLGADDFVMCGDNVDSSRDSREWRTTVIELVSGERIDAPPTVRLSDDRETSNDPEQGDGYVFHDKDGVLRRFAKEQVARVIRGERRPFVSRDEIVGPAFLIFWPVPPAGAFRPRIVR